MGARKTWDDDRLKLLVPDSKSYREVTIGLGLYPGNKTVGRVRDRIKHLGLDISHFKRGGHRPATDYVFKYGVIFNTNLKKRFLKKIEYRCLICGLSEWQDEPIILQVDHVDGDVRNNNLENLRLLCPNCHSQTLTWSKKKQVSEYGGSK